MNSHADLSLDQLFLIGQYFQWSEDETEFAMLLLERERTSLQSRKKAIQQKIDRIQQTHLEIGRALSSTSLENDIEALQDYYLNPWVQIVHVCLSIPRYAKDLQLLSRDLRVPGATLSGPTRLSLQNEILDLLKGAEARVKNAAEKDIYYMGFDLFRWT